VAALGHAIRDLGGDHDVGALAQLLDVDTQTARLRLRLLSPANVSAYALQSVWTPSGSPELAGCPQLT
jgi:hypothetical protein